MKLTRIFEQFLRPATIISALPEAITNGTTADAVEVQSDLDHIVSQVNANAAQLSLTPQLASANTFTAKQSGVSATLPANFPIATQVQNWVFNTLTSTLGTNTITARCATLTIGALANGQCFTFIPSQTNTGPVTLNPDGVGAAAIFFGGTNVTSGQIVKNLPLAVRYESPRFHVLGGAAIDQIKESLIDAAGDLIIGTAANTADRLAIGAAYRRLAVNAGATAPEWVADTQNTVVQAAGDLIYGTMSSTVARLPIGTGLQLLRVNAGATAPEWANQPDPTASSVTTFTNKRVTARVGSTTSSPTPTINTNNVDIYKLTAQAEAVTSFTTNLSGTPVDGDVLIIQITGTAARALTWGASFEASTIALPTTTVSTDMLTVGFLYNGVTSKWRCLMAV